MNNDEIRANHKILMKQTAGIPSGKGRPTPQHKLDQIKNLILAGESSGHICRIVHVTNSTVNKVRDGMR